MKSVFARTVFSGLGLSLLAGPAFAADVIAVEDTPVPVEERIAPEWSFSINPINGWLPGLNGDMSILGNDVSVDITAWDLIHNIDKLLHALDGFYEGSGEFRYNRFGLQYDVVYLALGGSRQFGEGAITGSADAAFEYLNWMLAGNYRIYETANAYLDVIGGARFTNVEVDLDLNILNLGFEATDGAHWVDPVVGVKGRYDLDQHWYLQGTALYGGFGLGSDWVYDLTGLIGYDFNNRVELAAGWRISDTSYEDGTFKWNMQLSGPTLGLTLKF